MRTLLILSIFIVFTECKQTDKSKHIESQFEKEQNESEILEVKDDSFNSEEFDPIDLKDYVYSGFLIGKKKSLIKNNISKLNISGYSSFEFNKKGLITKIENITNNYFEFIYDKNENLIKVSNKLRSNNKTYAETEYKFVENDSLVAVVNTVYNEQNEVESREISTALDNTDDQFSFVVDNAEEFKVNSKKEMILNYQGNIFLCCGESMMGKNRLIYYYADKGLIDSLEITNLITKRKKVFEYKYQ